MLSYHMSQKMKSDGINTSPLHYICFPNVWYYRYNMLDGERRMEALLILYAAAIPAVPFWGFCHFKKRERLGLAAVCLALTLSQILISGYAVYVKFFA